MAVREYTKQEAFNKAYLGMAAQKWARSVSFSKDENGNNMLAETCRYRGDGGVCCAIGHLIDDETAAKWETSSVYYLYKHNTLQASLRITDVEGVAWLDALQQCHDGCGTPEEIRIAFHEFATSYGLTIPTTPTVLDDKPIP